MATRKSVSKSSKSAQADFDVNVNKRTKNKALKEIKRTPLKTIAVALLVLVITAVAGFFTAKLLTKNDCFEIIGSDEIVLSVGETYKDEGVKVISFGKDLSDKVLIETDMKLNGQAEYYAEEEGTHYIIYTVDSIKYGSIFKIQKIRILIFEPAGESGE